MTGQTEHADCEAMVIGGGLAGSSLAITLARAGRAVTLIEKSKTAHPKVCGEFLSHEALHYLALLGVNPGDLGAVPIEAVRLAGDRVLAAAKLPFAAMSLSREVLDEAILRLAGNAGVRVRRGERAQSLVRDSAEWSIALAGGCSLGAKSAFLATGKHDLHGWPRGPGKQNSLIAFKMNWRLAPAQHAALGQHVELILFPGGYAGLQPVEQGVANVCLLVEKGKYQQVGGSWASLLEHMERHAAHLAVRLDGARALWERPLSLSSIPYGYVRADSADGVWRLGDQSAVIPSFAGDGMSIALHSAKLAAHNYVNGGSATEYQDQLARHVRRQVGLATLISRALIRRPKLARMVAGSCPALLPTIAGVTRIQERDLLT